MSRFEEIYDKLMKRKWVECPKCSGKKRLKAGDSGRFLSVSKQCPLCKGKGKVLDKGKK